MEIWGHGDASADNLINSAPSFRRLHQLGVDGVELDVRLTRDGQVVVHHDETYPDGRRIRDTTAPERPSSVLGLAEALELCAPLPVNIELKNFPADPDFDRSWRLVDVVMEIASAASQRLVFSCFDDGPLQRVRELDPGAETALLVLSRRPASTIVGWCIDGGHRAIHPYAAMVDSEFMAAARANDLIVRAWTSLDETDAEVGGLVEALVDAIITGRPLVAQRLAAQ